MLRLPTFEFHRAKTLAEAAEFLAKQPEETRVVAGGTDLWPNMKRRHQSAERVLSIQDIPELRGICEDDQGRLRIGATTVLTDIVTNKLVREKVPALARAVQSISSPVLRNMGTIGGNLCLDTRCTYYNQNEEWRQSINYCMKEQGEVCWVAPNSSRCWAISASDSAPMLCALGAEVRLVSSEGERTIHLTELYHDDGIDYLTKRRDEILAEVIVPAVDPDRAGFWKLRRRGSIDFAVLTVAAVVEFDSSRTVTRADLFMGAVGSFPIRIQESEEVLRGQELTEAQIAEAARVARKDGTPLNNTDFIPQWRSRMIERYVEAVLREVAGYAVDRLPPRHAL